MAKFTEDQLLALVAQYEKDALGSPVASGGVIGSTAATNNRQWTTLEIDRYDALNTYFARPIGNEVEGSSAVVIPELKDTIEWIVPQLQRIFCGISAPCVFDPTSPQDADQAEVETEYVNHVFMKENDGFFVIHDFIKDALLLRNGYAKVWVEEYKDAKTERYSGIPQDEVSQLLADKDGEKIDVLEQNEHQIDMPLGMPPMSVFDLKIRRTKETKRIRVACVPAEEMLVSPLVRGPVDNESVFVCHKTTKTRSTLIADGFSADLVNSLAPGKPDWMEMDALARNVVVDQMSMQDNPIGEANRAMQEIEVRDVAIRIDYDGDGIAELRHILIAGDKIIENEELEETPFVSCLSRRMPHRHTGLSLYDDLQDIQVIKSEVVRQMLNNLRLANNGRVAVDYRNCNLTDLMTSRAGGVVRTNGSPGNVIMPFQHPSNIVEQALPMAQYIDSWREFRTGVGKDTIGVDADALQNVTKGGQLAGMAAAGLKIEMMARCLAEGIKDIFLKIHTLIIRHQDQKTQFELRGKWVEIDPAQWRERTRVSANVGLGSGSREEARSNLMMLTQMQEKIASIGLVGPKEAYNTFRMGCNLLGYEQPEQYAMDPDSPQYQQWTQQHPPQPNPAVVQAQTRLQAAQVQAQAGLQKAQIQEQGAQARAQAEVTHAALQNREDRMVNLAGMDVQMFTEIAKILAPIVAAQLKQDPAVNAGTVLRQDIQGLQGS